MNVLTKTIKIHKIESEYQLQHQYHVT